MRLIALIAILFLRAIHGAEPAPKLELFVGQKWEAAKEVIVQAKLPEAGPRQEFKLDDNESHSYKVDEELVVTVVVSPSSESIVSMCADFLPEHRTSRADFVQKAVSRVSIDSTESYTIHFKRDLRTPEERQKDQREVMRLLKEQDEKGSHEESSPTE